VSEAFTVATTNNNIFWDVMFDKVKYKLTEILKEHVSPSSGSMSKPKKQPQVTKEQVQSAVCRKPV
jgi:hypothetical protein